MSIYRTFRGDVRQYDIRWFRQAPSHLGLRQLFTFEGRTIVSKIRMGRLSDFPPGSALEKRILARRVAVFNDSGELYGIEADCKHMRASLVNGGIKDGILTCKWHGWRYELATGKCLNVKGVKLKRFEVTIEGDEVFLHYDKRV